MLALGQSELANPPADVSALLAEVIRQLTQPGVLTGFTGNIASSQLFATRCKEAIRTLDDFDREDWIPWKAKARFAPVDYTTLTRDEKDFYAPPPLKPGMAFEAPDNAFWREFEAQKMIELVQR